MLNINSNETDTSATTIIVLCFYLGNGMSSVSEKRRDRRLRLDLDVEFTPGRSCDIAVPYTGTTQNVSAGGLYLETYSVGLIERGCDLVLKIGIPRRAEAPADPLVLRCEGTVCRIEQLPVDQETRDERFGVAVRFNNRPNVEFQSLKSLLWE